MTHARRDLLVRLEDYYDAVPRAAADVEECGPFTVFLSRGPWPYYARPRLGLTAPVTVDDVIALRRLQVERGVPEEIEWVPATTPSVGAAAAAAGLAVHAFPLMALTSPRAAAVPPGVVVRVLVPDDPSLDAVLAAVHRGFGADGVPDAAEGPLVRERIRAGRQVMAAAFDAEGEAVGGGAHQPVEGVTELVGIAVVPEARRRGIGAALSATLVADARDGGVDLVFLSAGDEAVARTYARVGFERIGTVSAAAPEAPTPRAPNP